MLSSRNISLATGYNSSILVNDGKLRTTGFEMQAIYHGKAGGLKYDLDLNLSHYKSVLKSMANPDYLYEYGALRTYVGGESVNSGYIKLPESSKIKQKWTNGTQLMAIRIKTATGSLCSLWLSRVISVS